MAYIMADIAPEVADAVKEIVRFLGYAAPLVLIPWLFKASSSTLGRLQGSTDKFFRGLGGKAKEPLSRGVRSAGLRAAGSKSALFKRSEGGRYRGDLLRRAITGTALGGARAEATKRERERQLGAAESQYLSQYAQSNPRFAKRAAGVSGAAGVTAVQAQAVSVAQKAEDEKLANSQTLLMSQLRDIGVDQKSLAAQLKKYLDDPSDTENAKLRGQMDANGNVKTIDLSKLDKDRMKAALHVSAGLGEVMTIEAARKASGAANGFSNAEEFQSMVDDVIYRNDGTLKGKGGYHLAVNYGLAYGRAPQIAEANAARDTARVAYTAANDQYEAANNDYNAAVAARQSAQTSGDIVAENAAITRMNTANSARYAADARRTDFAKQIETHLTEASNVFAQARLNGIADSSARDFSSMKSGVVEAVAKSLLAGMRPQGEDKAGNPLVDKLAITLNNVMDNAQLRADISQNETLVRAAMADLETNKVGNTPVTVVIPPQPTSPPEPVVVPLRTPPPTPPPPFGPTTPFPPAPPRP